MTSKIKPKKIEKENLDKKDLDNAFFIGILYK